MSPPRPSPSRSALFVVLEGIDGSGTTTQLECLADHLRARGRTVLPTREPSTGPIGKLLRELLLGAHPIPAAARERSDDGGVDGRTMALLFAADRRDHLAREIEPALAQGTDVVSDRYLLSSLAYQAVEADRVWVEALAEGIRQPDLTLVLDVPIAAAAERRRRAGRPTERYDADATLQRVAENYRRLGSEGRRWGKVVLVDGSGTRDAVARAVAAQVDLLIDQEAAVT